MFSSSAIEHLFKEFWKEKRNVRKKMIAYALSRLKSKDASANEISSIICKEYGLPSFPSSIVIDIIETEFNENIGSRTKEKWTFKNLPVIQDDSRLKKIILKIKSLYAITPNTDNTTFSDEQINEIIFEILDLLSNKIMDTKSEPEIVSLLRGASIQKDFEIHMKFILMKKYTERDSQAIIQIVKKLWTEQEEFFITYLIDYTASLMRIKTMKEFGDLNREQAPMKNTILVLDGNIIFSLCLETNPLHILALSAIKNAIDKGIEIQMTQQSWDEFKQNISFWNSKRNKPGGWIGIEGYEQNEIVRDYINSGIDWNQYREKCLFKINDLLEMGIKLVTLSTTTKKAINVSEQFEMRMKRFYDDSSPRYYHDLTISQYFFDCSQKNNCWLVSRHNNMIQFINSLVENRNCGALHLKQVHGWLVEFLSITITEESWKNVARSLIDKNLSDDEAKSPESLATMVSIYIQWKDNLSILLKFIKTMPKYKTLLSYWIKDEEQKFAQTLVDMMNEGLTDAIAKTQEEKEDLKTRMNQMRKTSNKQQYLQSLHLISTLMNTIIELMSDSEMKTELIELEKIITESDYEESIPLIDRFITLIGITNSSLYQMLRAEQERLVYYHQKMMEDIKNQ